MLPSDDDDATPARRNSTGSVVRTVLPWAGGCVLLLVLLVWMWGNPSTTLVREPSPDGRFEVVLEGDSWFLDTFTRLWLTTAGEQDRRRWIQIAPEVEGVWWAEWLAPDHLLLTDPSPRAAARHPHPVMTWRGVRVETVSGPR